MVTTFGKITWKASRFNEYLGNLNKTGWVIYNNLSGAMIEVKNEMYDIVRNGGLEAISEAEHIQGLSHASIIVPEDMDEIEALREKRNQLIESVSIIGLQILPTLACNFSCPYCYEPSNENACTMSEKVMDAIVAHLEKQIRPTTRYLNVLWYGGEPLLAIDGIQRLSQRFLDVCKMHHLLYSGSMITNGYLLTRKNVRILLENKVRFCQVTVDGPEHIHNQRRMLRNGGATWKTIIENVKHAVSVGMQLTLRMNVDKCNIDTIEKLVEILGDHLLLDKVRMSFGIVSNYGNVCRSIEDTLLTVSQANELLKQKNIRALLKRKSEKIRRARPDFIGCVATAHNSLIVGPEGELYKCSKNVGDTKEQCGTIFCPDELHPNFQK